MITLKQLIPDATILVRMHTAELAGYVLEVLMSDSTMSEGQWHRRNFCMQTSRDFCNYEKVPDQEVGIACSTAWAWLEANGLICRHPEQDNDWFIATPRGREVRDHQGLQQLISNEQLPEYFLHPEFLVNVRPLFLQSRFETDVSPYLSNT